MIADFPKIKETLHKQMDFSLREEVRRRAPVVSMIGHHFLHEGDKSSYETVDRQTKVVDFQKGESKFSVTRDEMSKMTIMDVAKKIQDMAEELAGQMEGRLFQTITEEVEKIGNVVQNNPPLSPDTLLQALEKIEIDFQDDSRDKPVLPTLVTGPELAEKAKNQMDNITLEEKELFDEKMKKILDKKYDNFLAREGKRKLVN